MRRIFNIILITGLFAFLSIFTMTNIASSSSMFDGEMAAKIIEVIKAKQNEKDKKLYDYKLKLKIYKLRYEGGHSKSHGICKKMIGQTKTLDFTIEQKKYENIIKKGNDIVLYYRTSFHPRVGTSKSWELRGEFIDYEKHKPVIFEKDELYGFKDYKGNVIINPSYKVVYPFNEHGITAVATEHIWYYIDYYERIIVRPYIINYQPDKFSEGLSRYINHHDEVGFIDEKGKIIIKAKYYHAMPFSEGLAAVCDGIRSMNRGQHRYIHRAKWGFINKKGEMVIKPKYRIVTPFKNGKATVYTEDYKKLVIDKEGNIIDDKIKK